MRARQSTTHLMSSKASSVSFVCRGSIVPFSFGGRVTHLTFTPLAIFDRSRSAILATPLGVTKPENITMVSFALAKSASSAASNVV
jgi:hypothetical protein